MIDDVPPELDSLWQEANEHFEHARFHKAIEIYQYILLRYSDNSATVGCANARLGLILGMLGEDSLAENHLRKAISCEPENSYYHYLLGCYHYTQYQWGQAVCELTIALDKEPNNAHCLSLLGKALFGCGDKEAGLDCLHRAMNLASSHPVDISWPSFHWDVLIDLAIVYLSIGNTDMAKVYGGQAVRAAPDSVMARAVLMKIDRACKKYQCQDSGSLPERSRSAGKTALFARIYQLKVILRNWPNKRAVIEIKGDQTLSSLHKIISRAFNRSDNRLYKFVFGYSLSDEMGEQIVPEPDGYREGSHENCARIDTLCQRLGQRFFYFFEDGDRSWHELTVTGLRYEVPRLRYPRVVRKHGSLLTRCPCEFSLKVPTPMVIEGGLSNN